MSGDRRFKIAFNYFGSKFGQLKWLLPLIPPYIKGENDHFAEVFGGSAVITLNLKPYRINTINDLDGNVVNFFRVLRDHPEEIMRLLYLTPHSHEEYDNSWDTEDDSDIERARKFFIRVRQSFGGLGSQKKNKGWAMATKESRCKISENTNKWLRGVDGLYEIIDRLKTLQIENRDYRTLIPLLNQNTTVLYLDPPYDHEMSPGSKDYKYGMSIEDHEELAGLAHKHSGKAIISGYESTLMKKLYSDWQIVRAPLHSRHMGSMSRYGNRMKTFKQECIWCNFDPFMYKESLFY